MNPAASDPSASTVAGKTGSYKEAKSLGPRLRGDDGWKGSGQGCPR